jgi:A/G-specific adenine glycosylase
MLQQTQVAAVIPYYERFLKRFPTVEALAAAEQDEVLRLWSGLGYYARGRNLHAAARLIVEHGSFPDRAEKIAELPGVGRSTAAAIAAFAFGERAAILDGNVKRVLARYFAIEGWPIEEELWKRAEKLLPKRDIDIYTQALMDLGATVCVRSPDCAACPVKRDCVARREGRTGEIPAPRPRKPVPSRDATWLILRHQGDVLLERRPSSGLWGGLWTFPELQGTSIEDFCRKNFGCEIAATAALQPLEHGFTHFNLRIRPLVCDTGKPAPRAEGAGRMWIAIAEAKGAAVPAPVRTLLATLGAGPASSPGNRSSAPGARGRRPARAAPALRRAAKAGSPPGAS